MKRDGALKSLWQEGMNQYAPKHTTAKDKIYDVIIVGGGITGLSTALLLQKAGKQCLVAEAHNICFGTTGGTTAHLNTTYDTPYSQITKNFGHEAASLLAKAAKNAIALIKQHIREYDISCGFEDAYACLYALDEKQMDILKDIHDSANGAGVKVTYTHTSPVPIPFKKAAHIDGQARFHPTHYVYGIAKAFEELGGAILQHCAVTGVEENEIVVAQTSQGVFKAAHLIYATHIPPGVNLLHLRCAPYRSYAMAVRLKGGAYPDGLAYDLDDPYHYFRTQNVHGKDYLIAGGEDHKTGHEEDTEGCFSRLEQYVREYFDLEDIAFRWSSQYFEPADGIPYIGHLPGKPGNIYVATGFGGNGMIYSQVAAAVLTNMITGKEDPYISIFNPNRIKPVAGFSNFVKENANVAKELITSLFAGKKIDELSELAKGEARVVKFEGHKLAAYRDEKGNLHCLNPTCKHMGCAVAWNPSEKSWDCPCHGARYGINGDVLTGPADRPLDIIQPEI